ncbi:redoxin domain-containing protein [Castellaniella sp.]|uniref:redoxin domain-containing protein n=1 Tax=Castellaniella sp. TaxID=1955812 RepID=UPI002B00165D|nr:redoxin domain-containing protein [Castellaniella sp.]
MTKGDIIPDWDIQTWLNTDTPLSLSDLRGSVVVVHAFQMLCPGCVSHGIPQAKSIHQAFPPGKLQVVGLHTVFEHHAAMTEIALRAFMHEYRIRFPVGIDRPDPRGNPIPLTMQAWRLQGTPTLVILDAQGHVRLHHFGQIEDLRVGAVIGQLLTEAESISP